MKNLEKLMLANPDDPDMARRLKAYRERNWTYEQVERFVREGGPSEITLVLEGDTVIGRDGYRVHQV
jgi:hypothetical protein